MLLLFNHDSSPSVSRLPVAYLHSRSNERCSIVEGLLITVHRGWLCLKGDSRGTQGVLKGGLKEEARWAATADLTHQHVDGKVLAE